MNMTLCEKKDQATLKSLIEEHARLDFSDFLSTLLPIFHVINKKFHPARLLIYLVDTQLLIYSGLLRDFRVEIVTNVYF